MFEIRRYRPEQANEWNAFVKQSKQGTFLFNRNYMDYHSDRFKDFSLIIYRKQYIYALLPANRVGNTLFSHQGLTYGGLITNEKATTANICKLFQALNIFLAKEGIHNVIYKAIPHIYHRLPAEEDLYALTNFCKANIINRHISTTIDFNHRLRFTESRKSGIRKAVKNGIKVRESEDLKSFWMILSNNLQQKYAAKPVHSLFELKLLKNRFPENIKLFMAYNIDNMPIGGILLYITPKTLHTQYISASPEGKRNGALDLIFNHLLNTVYQDQEGYFDFGKSSEGNGKTLNEQLIFQKEGFGSRGICYDVYEWSTEHINSIEDKKQPLSHD